MSKEKRLGRGLEALLSKVPAAMSAEMVSDGSNGTRQIVSSASDGKTDQLLQNFMQGEPVRKINVDLIDENPYQPRLDFDQKEIDELAESLKIHGLLQPLVVRENGQRFQLIAGERRLRAALQAGWKEIASYLLNVDDREMAELALTENMQRKDLNPIEKANAFRNYLDTNGGRQEDLAQRIGLDRSTLTNLLRLLDLPEDVQICVRDGRLSHSHARTLLPLTYDANLLIDCAERVINEGWTVRQTEDFVEKLKKGEVIIDSKPKPSPKLKRSENDVQIRDLEQQFRQSLGVKVSLCANEKGKGKLVIQFASNEEFEQIFQMICHQK